MEEKVLLEMFGDKEWVSKLGPFLNSQEFLNIGKFVAFRRTKSLVFPNSEDVFRAFRETPFSKVKVVFLGMDPYPTKGHALGRSFGINAISTSRMPPSLKNIVAELESDLGVILLDFDYSLSHWSKQGVLMLNAALTVEEKNPGSHMNQWGPFTKAVFESLRDTTGIIYILLGKDAQQFKKYINLATNYVLEAPHPAAEVYAAGKAGFFGCKIFSKTNTLLRGQNGINNEIIWTHDPDSADRKVDSFEEENENDPF